MVLNLKFTVLVSRLPMFLAPFSSAIGQYVQQYGAAPGPSAPPASKPRLGDGAGGSYLPPQFLT